MDSWQNYSIKWLHDTDQSKWGSYRGWTRVSEKAEFVTDSSSTMLSAFLRFIVYSQKWIWSDLYMLCYGNLSAHSCAEFCWARGHKSEQNVLYGLWKSCGNPEVEIKPFSAVICSYG